MDLHIFVDGQVEEDRSYVLMISWQHATSKILATMFMPR